MPTPPPRVADRDSTIPLLSDPYRYIAEQAHRKGSNIVRGRLLLQPCTFLVGAEAAKLFYDTERFQRAGAMPKPILKTLLGEGGVQGMDGRAHRHRKAMLMRVVMSPDRVLDLRQRTERAWRAAADRWSRQPEVSLYEGVQELLMRAVCDWADVPLAETEIEERTRDIALLFDAAGAKGPRHLASVLARRRCNRWLAGIIEQVRRTELYPRQESALHALAWHRDTHGELVSPENAAIGLNNVLRPTVAISVFITLAAHALHEHPAHRPPANDDAAIERFVQEVRRFYPFFPAVMAIAKQDIDWKGYRIPAGQRVVFDLHGTNHEQHTWGDPDTFRPGRFAHWEPNAYDLVPQGGGDHATNHRCPGEKITITLMKQAVRILIGRLRYRMVPGQDLAIDERRLPAIPKSHVRIHDVGWSEGTPKRPAKRPPPSDEMRR